MQQLDEQSLKKVALSFLKTYYKYRPRTGESVGKLDLRTKDGVIVDGHLSFPDENSKMFSATFESTTKEVKQEVFFSIQDRLLWWDGMAISSIFTVFAFTLLYKNGLLQFAEIGWIGFALKFFIFFLSGTVIYRLLGKNMRRYRYIYAVEQFKRYHANEQWIVLSNNVFNEATLGAFRELKKQLVVNGFGLIELDEDHNPHLLITPSRQEVFSSNRKVKSFMQNFTDKMVPINPRIGSYLKSNKKSRNYKKFSRPVWEQVSVLILAIIMLGFIGYKEWQERPIWYEPIDEHTHILPGTLEPDTFYLNEKEKVVPAQKVKPYLNIKEDVQKSPEKNTNNQPHVDVIIGKSGEKVVYDCSRFYNLRGQYYLLVDSIYENYKQAFQRMERLQNAGFDVNCYWLGCFIPGNTKFVISLDLIFSDHKEAKENALIYSNQLKNRKLLKSDLSLLGFSR